MDDIPYCAASQFTYLDPCTVWPFETAEFTEHGFTSAFVFLLVVIIVLFLVIITYTCLVNTSTLAMVNAFKNTLERLDVGDSGVTTHEDQGKTFVIEKPKNVEGGTAVFVLVMVCAVMISYVVATEIDLPAEVLTQRKYFLDPSIKSPSFAVDAKRFELNSTNILHQADLGVILTDSLKSSWLYFENNQQRKCKGETGSCLNSQQFISYSISFWIERTINEAITLCSDQPVTDESISFFTRAGNLPNSTKDINLPMIYFNEEVMQYVMPRANGTTPAVSIAITATSSVTHSIFSSFTRGTGIHAIRVDSARPTSFLGSSCNYPVIQFQVTGDSWELMGIEKSGVRAVILSVFGAVGTVLGTRALLKEAIEWITKQWRSSPKKRFALAILAYVIQTVIACAGLIGLVGTFKATKEMQALLGEARPPAVLIAIFVLATVCFSNAIFCWIGATVVFTKNWRRHMKAVNTKSEAGEYVLLSDKHV